MDFLKNYEIIYSNKQHQNIYNYFNQSKIMTVEELFLIATVIGFNYPEETDVIGEGLAINGSDLSSASRMKLYTMILTDRELGKNVLGFQEKEFQERAIKRIEEYADMGIRRLVQEVFMDKWDGLKLSDSYLDYKTDILSYIHTIASENIF